MKDEQSQQEPLLLKTKNTGLRLTDAPSEGVHKSSTGTAIYERRTKS
jgi:hypothetical protein